MKGGKPHLGCFTMEGEQFKHVPDHWFTYFAVNDVDKSANDVTAAGGAIVRPPFDIPGVGRIAIVKDVNGGVFGLGKPAAPMAAASAPATSKPKKTKAKT